MAEGRYLIGIDVGPTAVKGGLFDQHGAVRARHTIPYPTARPEAQRAEQNPDDWTAAIDAILAALLKDTPAISVAAIGLCSQVNTHVFVDRNGSALLPAIVWQDGRCARIAAELDAQVSAKQKLAWWGAPSPIGASNVAARMAWVARHQPAVWEQTAYVLSPKDYCLFALTGIVAADPISSFDIVDMNGKYIRELLALVPGAADRMPPLREFDQVLGPLRVASGPGPMVVNGTMDGWACLPGAGVSQAGEGAYVSGTSEIVTLASDRRVGAPGIVSFPRVNDWHVFAGPTQSGGDSLRWFAQATGHSIDAVLDRAAQVDRAKSRMLFLPHLEGERAPLWDPHSRGAFVGMNAGTGFGELSAAVLEGVGFSARLLFEAASNAAGRSYDFLFLGGGGARSDLWCQIRADIMGVELRRNAVLDSGTLGAAVIAGVGVGLFPSLPTATREMLRIERSFVPNLALADNYNDLFSLYQETYQALSPVHHRLKAEG
jgi:xylulokinase